MPHADSRLPHQHPKSAIDVQHLKGRLILELSASLKRCPDTNLNSSTLNFSAAGDGASPVSTKRGLRGGYQSFSNSVLCKKTITNNRPSGAGPPLPHADSRLPQQHPRSAIDVQPLKGRLILELSASLKRCPDTNLNSSTLKFFRCRRRGKPRLYQAVGT